ncbi:MAG: hypothetical protein HGA80_06470, partial [Candidatus Omnitrophica bacterium]|nr:hypothetical protein [Candidatus Omnitrophota bacterium]
MATGNLKQKIVALAVVAALLALAWWTGRIFFIGEPVVREFFSRFPFWLDAVLLVV